MAEMMTLSVRPRAERGKGTCRRMLAKNLVPGVYYNQKGQNISVVVDMLPLTKLHRKVGSSRVFHLEMDMDGKAESLPSLIWDMQFDPLKSTPIHVDFYGVDLEREIKVDVKVVVEGKAKGIVLGGLLEIFRETLEVICKPLDVPEKIVIDVTDLDLGVNLHIDEIKLPAGVKAVYDDNFAVVGIVAQEAEEEAKAAEPAAAAAKK
ncbi:MAG: 50S ribosomal protein L25 [Deltaproteobacteria bacterium HGW-Deltaproteobacteria-8]|jgi:large subunit ribosomal protein L25|nr:MAG: 50S ribosomal protein L25 [Deltaproteobacteria bacterium HGW-Deltaproteobacteria-8]